ncbi:hypothetical protein NPIL_474721, partial [Nephila pilipes]
MAYIRPSFEYDPGGRGYG